MLEHATMKLATLAALVALTGCTSSDEIATSSDAGPTDAADGDAGSGEAGLGSSARVHFDVSSVTSLRADQLLRPSVTAYLADDDPGRALDLFLSDFDGRVGMVLYEGIETQLHRLAAPPGTEADLPARLAASDEIVSKIVGAGGTALLTFKCAMPDFLSLRSGHAHDVLTGELVPAGATVSACSPPREDNAAREGWTAVMEAVGAYFSKYGDQVVYLFGGEPENYFVGTAEEMFATYGLAIRGILAGHPGAKIAGITAVDGADEMSKAVATYHPPPEDRYEFTEEQVGAPLLQEWLAFASSQSIPVDFATFHIWNPSARPRAGAWFEESALELEQWLKAVGYSGRTTLMPTDFAGWENSCLVDAQDTRESYYDSEYLAAMFVDHAIASLRYGYEGRASFERVDGVNLVYGYLLEMRAYAPCIPVVGELGGYPGMVTKFGVPKPSYNGLHLMTRVDGNIGFPSSDDSVVAAVGAYQDGPERVSILLTRHIPSELHFVSKGGGYAGYSLGSLFQHAYGFAKGPLKDEELNDLLASYWTEPDFPKQFVHDLLSDPAPFSIDELGLSSGWTGYLKAARAQGLSLRRESASNRRVEVTVSGLAGDQYQVATYAVDRSHGNAYRERAKIQARIDATGGDTAALAVLAAELRETYGTASTVVDTRTVSASGGSATVELEMEPNSVWAVVLAATN